MNARNTKRPPGGVGFKCFAQPLQGPFMASTIYIGMDVHKESIAVLNLLKPHVARLVVRNPHRNAFLKAGNKSDRIDARKLAEVLRGNELQPVHHGEPGLPALKEYDDSSQR